MKNFLIFSAFVILLFTLFSFKKTDSEKEDDTSKQTNEPAPTDENGTVVKLDAYSGEGEQAVERQMFAIVKNDNVSEELRRENNIGKDLFSGISKSGVKIRIRDFVRKQLGATTDFEIKIIPEKLDGKFISDVRNLRGFAENFNSNFSALGQSGAVSKLDELSDFTGTVGWKLNPNFLMYDLVCDKQGYGECRLRFGNAYSKTREDQGRQLKEYAKDLISICENIEKASNAYYDVVFEKSIENLTRAGWEFEGII